MKSDEGTMSSARARKAVLIVEEPEKIELMANLERLEILRLLDINPMTESELSEKLGMTKASVGYHLHLLVEADLIKIDKMEAEEHGILQKFYASKAALYVPDYDRMPDMAKKLFTYLQMERLRGILGMVQLLEKRTKQSEISSSLVEELASEALGLLATMARAFERQNTNKDREVIASQLYSRVLVKLMKTEKWKMHLDHRFR